MKYKVNETDKNNLIKSICEVRGVEYANLDNFLNPTKNSITNGNIYINLSLVAHKIIEAIKGNKTIGILIDSDVDGYCSSAMLVNYFKEVLGFRNVILLMHEGKEHGLTESIMKQLEEYVSVDMLLIPDAGSNDFEQHKRLLEKGIDVIVIDHHETTKYSEYATVVNNQLGEGNKTLCGAGMVMKVLEKIDEFTDNSSAHYYMDLCGTALVGDCMPMTHSETRYYTQTGLRNINNPLLFELYRADKERDFEAVSFDIAPIINAYIRVGTKTEKADLFNAMIGLNYSRSIKLRSLGSVELPVAEYISALASRIKSRQTKDVNIALEEKSKIITSVDMPILICVLDEDVNKTLTGLIANRLVDKYDKPALVLKAKESTFNGSARTTNTLNDFRDYLLSFELFDYCEGHQQAFGVGISFENMHKLLNTLKHLEIREGDQCHIVDGAYVDMVSAFDIMSVDELRNHWCKGFEKPLFYIKLTEVNPSCFDVIGKNKDTIRIKHRNITYIKFKCSKEEVKSFLDTNITEVEMVGRFAVNEWNNNLYPQVQIEELEIKGSKKTDYFTPSTGNSFFNMNW